MSFLVGAGAVLVIGAQYIYAGSCLGLGFYLTRKATDKFEEYQAEKAERAEQAAELLKGTQA